MRYRFQIEKFSFPAYVILGRGTDSGYAKSGQMTMHRPTSARVNTTLINAKSARTFLYKSGARTRTWFKRLSQRTRRGGRGCCHEDSPIPCLLRLETRSILISCSIVFCSVSVPLFHGYYNGYRKLYSHTYAYNVLFFLSLSLFHVLDSIFYASNKYITYKWRETWYLIRCIGDDMLG